MSAESTPTPENSRRKRSLAREPGQQSRRAICYQTPRDGGERVRLAEDIDPDYRDSITVSEPDGREYDDEPPDLPLPGSGEQYDECGEDIPMRYCEDCGTPTWVGNTCRRSRCPRCWQSWVFQRALEAATAVDATRKAKYDRSGGNVYNHHVVVSPPEGITFNTDDPVSKLFDAAKNLLGHVNADAGYLVYHPDRIKDEYRGDVRGHESGEGEMQWKDIMSLPADERDEYLTHSPHIHAFVASSFVGEWDRYDETGFVVHRIADDTGTSLADLEALAAAVAYSLSHAGIATDDETGAHRVRAIPFGETASIQRPDWIRAKAETAMREVAGQVLGVSFRRDGCQQPADAAETAGGSGKGSETPAAANALTAPHSAPNDSETGGPIALGGSSGSGGAGGTNGFGRSSGGSETPVATDGGAPETHNHADRDRETCGGRLVGIWTAPDALENDEWRELIGAETANDLRAAYDEWVSMGEPVPDALESRESDGDPPPG